MRIGMRDARHGTALRARGLAIMGVAAAALTACSSSGGSDGAGVVDTPGAAPRANPPAGDVADHAAAAA